MRNFLNIEFIGYDYIRLLSNSIYHCAKYEGNIITFYLIQKPYYNLA